MSVTEVLIALVMIVSIPLPLFLISNISWRKENSLHIQNKANNVKHDDALVKQSSILEKAASLGVKDAKKGDYTADLVFSKHYEKAYKEERIKVVERKAKSDALQRYRFETGQMSFEPVLQGQALEVPAEIAMYQVKFIEEKSKLETNDLTLTQPNKALPSFQQTPLSKDEFLQKIYEDETQQYIEQEDFYEVFQVQTNPAKETSLKYS